MWVIPVRGVSSDGGKIVKATGAAGRRTALTGLRQRRNLQAIKYGAADGEGALQPFVYALRNPWRSQTGKVSHTFL